MTISPARDESPRRRLNFLERWVQQIERQLHRQQDAEWQSMMQVRLCRTTAGGGQYPESGNTVRIIFLDGRYEPVPGDQPLVSEDREAPYSTVARTVDGSLPPEGSILPAAYIPPIDANKGYWWLLTSEGQPPAALVRFRLTAPLGLAGKTTAVEITTGGSYTAVGDAFPIKDPWANPGSWRDDTAGTYMGWCILPTNPEIADGQFLEGTFNGVPFREIVWMEEIATYINFTSTSATTKDEQTPSNPWTVTATIDDWYQGKDPADAFESFTLYDPQQIWPRIITGSKGKARYNDRQHRYEIVAVRQAATRYRGQVDGSFVKSDPTATIDNLVALDGLSHGFDDITAQNTHHWDGPNNGAARVEWNETDEQWELYQVDCPQ